MVPLLPRAGDRGLGPKPRPPRPQRRVPRRNTSPAAPGPPCRVGTKRPAVRRGLNPAGQVGPEAC